LIPEALSSSSSEESLPSLDYELSDNPENVNSDYSNEDESTEVNTVKSADQDQTEVLTSAIESISLTSYETEEEADVIGLEESRDEHASKSERSLAVKTGAQLDLYLKTRLDMEIH